MAQLHRDEGRRVDTNDNTIDDHRNGSADIGVGIVDSDAADREYRRVG
jgi:hypothetical protein